MEIFFSNFNEFCENLHFFYFACSVCFNQSFEFLYFTLQYLTLIGISDKHSFLKSMYSSYRRRMEHLCPVRLQRAVRFVFRQSHESGIENKCISGNSRLFLICLGHTSINHYKLASSFYRAFTILYLDRHMSVQDM